MTDTLFDELIETLYHKFVFERIGDERAAFRHVLQTACRIARNEGLLEHIRKRQERINEYSSQSHSLAL